jgi:hypothetical protein
MMSLNWNTGNCKYDRESKSQQTNAERLIWETLAVDLGSITEQNLDEWVFRMAVLKILRNRTNDNFGPVTIEFLRPYVGLLTNVSNTSRAKFMNKCKDMLQREALDAIRYQEEDEKHELEQIALKQEWDEEQETKEGGDD